MLIRIYILATLLFFGCESTEPRKPINNKSGEFVENWIYNTQLRNTKELEILKNYTNVKKINVIQSPSGFMYYYEYKNNSSTYYPKFGDKVYFSYNVKLPNNQIIYSEKELGLQVYQVDQQELIKGLREGIKLMKSGEKITLLLPSQQAYGLLGDGNKIKANTPIICQVFLQKIIKNNES